MLTGLEEKGRVKSIKYWTDESRKIRLEPGSFQESTEFLVSTRFSGKFPQFFDI